MRKLMPSGELARDDRFVRITMEDVIFDPRNAFVATRRRENGFDPRVAEAPDSARGLMHGIFVGEIQALEGAGRTCWDFETGSGEGGVPFELKLDMARQCWDEARHVEISVKLSDHMGTEIGEFAEQTLLFEAACNADPVLRLAGVNRALEGLAIDVFNTMRDFGGAIADPVLYFCEDWMLADEVTHVKMGSDWLRRITANDPERQQQALDFQRTVDKLFSFGGFRGEEEENPIHLARKFRGLAGFTDDEITELVDIAAEAYAEAQAQAEAAAACPQQRLTCPVRARPARPPRRLGVVRHHRQRARGRWALAAHWLEWLRMRALWWFTASSSWRSSCRWPGRRARQWRGARRAPVPHVLRLRRDHRRRHLVLVPRDSSAAGSTCSTASAACS